MSHPVYLRLRNTVTTVTSPTEPHAAAATAYFGARGDAGLSRAWLMIAVGAAEALIFGSAMMRYYDRKGLRRLTPQPMTTQPTAPSPT